MKPRLVKISTGWMCCFPPKSVNMIQCITAIKPTPKEAYIHCMELVAQSITDPFIWESTPVSRRDHERWAESESRRLNGTHRPWSIWDCKVRNGYWK